MRKKLLIIGIDGVSWNLIGPMVESGEMPALEKIMKDGTYGMLKTIVPPSSNPAWPTFFTGKNPGKTSGFSFFKIMPNYTARYALRTDVKAEAIWGILSKNGFRCNVANVPITFPPEKINGTMVGQVYHPLETNGFVFPETLEEKVKEIWRKEQSKEGKENPYIEQTAKTFEIFKLVEEQQSDFSMVVFLESDRIQHTSKENLGYLRKYFSYLDSVLSKIIASVGSDTTVLVLSDHGSTSTRKLFKLTTWLIENKYLFLKKRAVLQDLFFETLKKIGLSRGIGYGILKSLGLKRFVPKLPQGIRKALKEKRPDTSFRDLVSIGMVDWKKTIVFSHQTTGIHINKKGFFENGIVEEKDVGRIRKEIKEKLTADAGMSSFFLPEGLYNGGYLDEAPDVIFESGLPIDFSDRYSKGNTAFLKESDRLLSVHTVDGIYAIRGPNIAKGKKIDLGIMDLTKAVLHIFGIPVPSDFDGKFPAEIFSGKEREKRAGPLSIGTEVLQSTLSKEDEEKIIKSLKELDYV